MPRKKPDIFEECRKNVPRLETKLKAIQENSSDRKKHNIDRLIAFVENECSLSLNAGGRKLKTFLTGGELLTLYEVFKTEEELRFHLNDFYDARMAFDGHFRDGKKFTYIALNPGNSGMPKVFGAYTVFLETPKKSIQKKAFLIRNSLQKFDKKFIYFTDDKKETLLKRDELLRDLSDDQTKALLTVIKHHHELDEDWSQIVESIKSKICYDHKELLDYIECITTDRIVLGHILKIYISPGERESISQTVIKHRFNNKISMLNVKWFNRIQHVCKRHNIGFEIAEN